MKLSSAVKATRARFVAAFPVPSINSGEDQQVYEERCRQWSIHLAEQIAFELPGQGYGVKRGDSGRPICKDCLARSTDGQLLSWDMLRGASSGHPALNDDPDSLDLTGPPDGPQFFEDRPQFFNPQNRLGAVVVPPQSPPGPGEPPPSGLDAEIRSFMVDVRTAIGRIEKKQAEPPPAVVIPPAPPVNVKFPDYEGSVFGARVTLKPKP